MSDVHASRVIELGDTTFFVYRAKSLFSRAWESTFLSSKVAQARETYQVYNDSLPLLDSYDDKSAVYLVQARYPIETDTINTEIEEWISLRFVPAVGEPELSEDLKHHHLVVDGMARPLLPAITETFAEQFGSEQHMLKGLFTYSRLSACRPRTIDSRHQDTVAQYWRESAIRTKNRWTQLAFALMNDQFFTDYDQTEYSPTLFTTQINGRLAEVVFNHRMGSTDSYFSFPYAYTVLGFKDPNAVRLDRQQFGKHLYQYPGYFLQTKDLVAALDQLIQQGLMSQKTLEPYLPVDWDSIKEAPVYYHLSGLGPVLTQDGPLPESQITGMELRSYLDQVVGDGVKLRILDADSVRNQCKSIISEKMNSEKGVENGS